MGQESESGMESTNSVSDQWVAEHTETGPSHAIGLLPRDQKLATWFAGSV